MNDGLRDAAFRAGVWQFIEQRAKAMKDDAKAELAQLEPGDAVSGKWHGQPVAKATMTKGRTKLVVTDEQKFLEWIEERHPSELVTSVNPAYVKWIEKTSICVDGSVIDQGGELVPGVEIQQGDSYISVRKADGAEDVIAELFRTGSVGLEGIKAAALPALPEPTNRFTQDREAAGF